MHALPDDRGAVAVRPDSEGCQHPGEPLIDKEKGNASVETRSNVLSVAEDGDAGAPGNPAFVAMLDPTRTKPDALAVVDVEPGSMTYGADGRTRGHAQRR